MVKRVSIAKIAFLCAYALLVSSAAITQSSSVPVVDDFGYQLQNYVNGLESIRQSAFDLVVIDYSVTGDATGEWSAQQIEHARSGGPCRDRIMLSYLSIGEAESYRFYWDEDWVDGSGNPVPGVAPVWLGPENPDWEGNYKVRYWMPGWQEILFGNPSGALKSYLDRIIDQGFDGVYLDIVDAFEYWGPAEIDGNNEHRTAPSDMIDLISNLAHYARVTRGHPGFLIVPQNGSYIIDPDCYPDAPNPELEAQQQRARYFSIINAIGAEDTFFTGPLEENNPYNPDEFVIELLNRFRDADITVLSIEYVTNPTLINNFYTLYAPARGYIPYATVRALDQLPIHAGFEPDCEATETPSPTPMITVTVTPTLEPTYCNSLSVAIRMPASHFTPGDTCFCQVDISNQSSDMFWNVPLFVVLDVYGIYFCAPRFIEFDYFEMEIPPGMLTQTIVDPFEWPQASGSAQGIYWYAALTDPAITMLCGEFSTFEFGWSE